MRIATFLAPRLWPLYEQVTHAVGASLDTEATLEPSDDPGVLLDGDFDAAFVCGLPYVNLRDRAGEAVEPLVAPVLSPERYGERPIYFSDVVVRHHDPAQGFEDLRGRRWAYNEPGSHSGSNLVLSHLSRMGLGTDFFSGYEGVGSHVEALRSVVDGEADAAAIDSHLLDVLRADDPDLGAAVRAVASLGPSPIQPLVAGPGMSPGDRDSACAAVARLGSGPPGTFVKRWVPVTDADYDLIRAMRDEAAGLAVV